jgi:hypothetical protein
MSDDDTTTRQSADADTQPDGSGPDGSGSEASGVTIPAWLAGALVVVLALVVAGAGFAIGRATAPDDDGFRPVVATEDGGGRGGLPGFPGGPQERGGSEGRRGIPGGPGERQRPFPGDDESGDEDSEVPSPPELPGT